MTMFFSSSKMAFYDDSLKEDYERANAWPEDVIKITESKYNQLLNGQSNGQVISVDSNGKPILIASPAPTHEELVSEAETKKASLMISANTTTAPLLYAVETGMATASESDLLLEWKKYLVLLNRVDPSLAPDIEWPPQPCETAGL